MSVMNGPKASEGEGRMAKAVNAFMAEMSRAVPAVIASTEQGLTSFSRLLRNTRIILTLVTIFASVVALLASMHILTSIAELRRIEARLVALDDFEKRVFNRIDTSDAGVQNLIDLTNSRISSIRPDIEEAAAKNRENAAELQATVESLRELADRIEQQIQAQAQARAERPVETSKTISVPRDYSAGVTSAPQSTPEASPSFQRVEGPDGSVTYKKVR